ncbi:MAG: hypothetical protein AAF664_14405 [Planctomycetota bacterium]
MPIRFKLNREMLMCVGIAILQVSASMGQPPELLDQVPPSLPKLQPFETIDESKKEDSIREMLSDPRLRPATTGDGLLDDVLEVIRRNGSILDGSSLDPNSSQSTGDSSPPSKDEPASVAMQLLATAQSLSHFDEGHPDGSSHAPLILKLRQAAGKLLLEAYGH